ncbi:amidohydrolase [Rhodoferax koreense]|uniref:Amidohydrolase n=1 Tax=Rhodoferax koreensis TaxID=1842727 RepID=A0A1P8K319_9BURK|nr:amidohydrolase family protein [Rhodoferax koreense]APW40331.1 amidohydrolase [Rhodoferax koreense]
MIDAHFHIWRLARADYGWLTPALAPIYRDVAFDDWRAVSRPCGFRAGIVVQAAPTEAETAFLLEQADAAPDVLGVVGWVDMLAADAPRRIEMLARRPKLKGLRPMLQDIADPDWILQPGVQPALHAMAAAGLVFDALVKPVHLPRILALAMRHPDLRIVIDHGAKPDIAAGQWDDWAEGLRRLAGDTSAFCKLSGLWNEAGPGASGQALRRHAGFVLECFGPARTLWGSDWPVLELAGGYAEWFGLAQALVPPEAREQVFGATARVAYGL